MRKNNNPLNKAKGWRDHTHDISPSSAAVKKAAKTAQNNINGITPIRVNNKTWVYPKQEQVT